MTDQLVPMATIQGEEKELTLAYDATEHVIYALNEEGEIEPDSNGNGYAIASPELKTQGDAVDFIRASYGRGWNLSWID